MNTLELYVAAEAIYSHDTWWFLGFLPPYFARRGLDCGQGALYRCYLCPSFLGPLIWFVFVRGKEDTYGRS